MNKPYSITSVIARACLFLLLVAPLVISSCSDKVGPNTSNGVNWTIPNVGSYYVLESIDLPDTSIDTFWVTARGAAHGEGNTVTLDTGLYLAYRTNGDIATWSEDTGWSSMPTGGGTIIDSEVNQPVGQPRHVNRRTKHYMGTESVSLMGTTFSSIKIHEDDSIANYDNVTGALMDTGSESHDYWFIPSLGFIGKEYDDNGTWWSSEQLIAYKLQ